MIQPCARLASKPTSNGLSKASSAESRLDKGKENSINDGQNGVSRESSSDLERRHLEGGR